MSNPCDSCAFREGAAAHSEIYSRLRAEICALTGVPFWCHHTATGTDVTSQTKFLTKAELRARGMRICEGWKQEVRKHVKPGMGDVFKRLFQRWKGEATLILIENFVDAKNPEEKREIHDRLSHAIKTLHTEDGFTEIMNEQ